MRSLGKAKTEQKIIKDTKNALYQCRKHARVNRINQNAYKSNENKKDLQDQAEAL